MKKLIAFIMLSSLLSCEYDSQSHTTQNIIRVNGTIIDSINSEPLAGAIIELDMYYSSDNWDDPGTTSTVAIAYSDDSGYFDLEYTYDEGTLDDFAVRMPFYHPIHPTISVGHNKLGILRMRPRTGNYSRYLLDNSAVDMGLYNADAMIFNGRFTEDRFMYPLSALQFNKASQTYMSIPAHVELWNSSWTFSIWFRLDSLPRQKDDAVLFRYSNEATSTADAYLYVDNDDNQIKFFDGQKSSTGITVDSLKWYHAAITFDGSAIKLYVNGMKKTEDWFLSLDSTDSDRYIIGSDVPGTKGGFDGAVDDIRFYDYRLASYEINAVYEEEKDRH